MTGSARQLYYTASCIANVVSNLFTQRGQNDEFTCSDRGFQRKIKVGFFYGKETLQERNILKRKFYCGRVEA